MRARERQKALVNGRAGAMEEAERDVRGWEKLTALLADRDAALAAARDEHARREAAAAAPAVVVAPPRVRVAGGAGGGRPRGPG